jgi:predicted TPR repeat methyltransferase
VDRGVHALQQALALPAATGAPGHDAAHWRLGMLHELKGDRAAARIAYESSLRINPAFAKASDALAKLN